MKMTTNTNKFIVDKEDNFKFAASAIKFVSFAIAIMVLIISKNAFIFFVAAMLPTLMAIFFDRKNHKCASATICTFNLIGVLPFLIRLWNTNSIDSMAKSVISDIDTWIIVYGAAFIGQLLYMALPLLITKLHVAKIQVNVEALEKRYSQISKEWGIIEDNK